MSRMSIEASTSASESVPSSSIDVDARLHPFVTHKLVETGKYYCPFLERGFCRESSSKKCNFSHRRTATRIPTDFCHFYLANQCLYGQDCKFIHDEPLTNPVDEGPNPHEEFNLTRENYDHQDHAAQEYHDHGDGESEINLTMVNEYYYPEHNVPDDQISCQSLEDATLGLSRISIIDKIPSKSAENSVPTSSSSSAPHDNANVINKLMAIKPAILSQSTASTPSSSYVPLRTIVSYGLSSSSNSSDGLPKPPTSTIIDGNAQGSASSSTKAWQGGRLLASLKGESSSTSVTGNQDAQLKDLPLCPYSLVTGGCPYAKGRCAYLHGQICDLCCLPCLHPHNELQRRQHRDDCLREHEREMELSFAVQRSKDKICGICMDTVVEKKPVTSSRFGILEKCNHIFCLDCIRKWRGTKQFDSKTIRACPECRVNSDFVVPSKYWVEDQDDKDKLIRDYKAALRSKPCRYFNEGKGECPFAGSCFYKHAYPDGSLAETDAPRPKRRVYGARGTTTLTNYVLWSLIRSFDDEWSNDDDSEFRYYNDDEEDEHFDDDDDIVDEEDEGDDDEALRANIAEWTASIC